MGEQYNYLTEEEFRVIKELTEAGLSNVRVAAITKRSDSLVSATKKYQTFQEYKEGRLNYQKELDKKNGKKEKKSLKQQSIPAELGEVPVIDIAGLVDQLTLLNKNMEKLINSNYALYWLIIKRAKADGFIYNEDEKEFKNAENLL